MRTSPYIWSKYYINTIQLLVLLSTCFFFNLAKTQTLDKNQPWNWPDDYVIEQVNHVRAGRDLNPNVWPDDSKVAVLLSYDVDNETTQGLRTGEINIGPLSQGQYGSRVALPRIVKLMDDEAIPATFFFPAWSLKLAPEQADLVLNSGRHEIGVHGWIHELNTSLDKQTEERLLRQAINSIETITGTRPIGFRAPSWNFSPNTLEIIEELDFLYESSLMHDDRPYELLKNGSPTGIVELPVEWILDDAPLLNPLGNRYMNPRDIMQVWIDEFDAAWDEGTMFLLTMHPHIIGHRSRMVALKGLIEHMKDKEDVWFGTHEQAARWVRQKGGIE